jgi:hypothetical protein
LPIQARCLNYLAILTFPVFLALLQVACSSTGAGDQTISRAVDFDLTNIGKIDSASITISNSGSSPVVMPDIALAGSPALNRPSILSSVETGGALSDEQFSIATWNFMNQHMTAFCSAGSRTDPNSYSQDPLDLLRGYGFGCCGQISEVLVWLWQGQGYQARVAAMSFHTVSEIYYKGAWHMYDSDHQVYYLERDNQTVASVADLIADPYLVARVADANGNDPVGFSAQWMADQYAAAGPSLNYSTPNYEPDEQFTLRPSESVTLYSENQTSSVFYLPVQNSLGRQAPYSVNSAHYDLSLDFAQPGWKALSTASDNVTTVSNSTGVYLTSTGSATGDVIFPMSSPYPVLGLQVNGVFYETSSEAGAGVNAYFSIDGNHWSDAVAIPLNVGVPAQANADLTVDAAGAYTYFVKIEFYGTAGVARAGNVNIEADVQVSKAMFPELTPGVVNHLTYSELSNDPDSESVSTTLSVQQAPATSNGVPVPISAPASTTLNGGQAWQVQAATGYLNTGGTFTWPTSASGSNFSLFDQYPGAASQEETLVQNLAVTSQPNAVEFISPSSAFWIVNPVQPQVEIVGRPAIQPAQAVSAVPENPSLLPADGAASLIDGNLDTQAYPGSTHLDYTVSLNNPTHVSSAAISWGTYGILASYVQSWTLYGRNGSTQDWQALAQGGFPDAATTGIELNQIVTDLRIVADGGQWIGIYEFTVSGAEALSGLTAISNIMEVPWEPSFSPASNVTDGNDSTDAYDCFIDADYSVALLGSTYVDAVRIVWGYFGTNSVYINHWQLYGQKTAGDPWQVLARGTFPGATETVVSVLDTFQNVRVAAESDQNWIGIYEMQVFGNPMTETTAVSPVRVPTTRSNPHRPQSRTMFVRRISDTK